MSVVQTRVIRILMDMAAPESASIDANTTAAPASFWRNPLTVQIGLKNGASYIDDVTGITKVSLYIKSKEYLTAGAYVTKEDNAPAALTSANWLAGTHQSASFALTTANLTLPIKATSTVFYLLVRVTKSDGSEYTAGWANFTIVDDGYVPPADALDENYLTEEESDARYVQQALGTASFRVKNNEHVQLYCADGKYRTIAAVQVGDRWTLDLDQTGDT